MTTKERALSHIEEVIEDLRSQLQKNLNDIPDDWGPSELNRYAYAIVCRRLRNDPGLPKNYWKFVDTLNEFGI